MKKQVISYIRFSSAQQGKGSSTARQQEMIGAWLRQNPDFELSNLSVKDLGVSAFTGKHLEKGLGVILEAIEQKKIQSGTYLLVEAIDRLGRLEPLEMVSLMQKIVTAGVSVCTLEDGQIYTKEALNNNHGSLFLLVGKVQQAHQYSTTLSRRVSAAYENKRKNAIAGNGVGSVKRRNAFWLDSDGKLKERESEIVRACIALYLAGRGTRAICLELNKTYPELKTVHPSTIKRWFMNKSLIGEWDNSGQPISDVFEPLITVSQFYEIERQLVRKRLFMSPEQQYSLSGLVCCADCGKAFYFRRKKHNGSVIVYGNCSTYLKRGTCSNNSTLPYEVLEYAFDVTHSHCLVGIAAGRVYEKEIEQASIAKTQIVDIDAQLQTCAEHLLTMEALPTMTKNILERAAGLEDKKKALQQKVDTLLGMAAGVGYFGEEFDVGEDQQGFKLEQPPNQVQHEFERLSGSSDALRDALREVGYKLVVNGRTIMSTHGFLGGERYEMMKRSTRFKCYLVNCYTPYDVTTDFDGNPLDSGEDTLEVVAIRRDGKLEKADSMDQLLAKLEVIKAVEDQENSRSNLSESA
jgi:DNA invertase Pin-like site-specific DNA recombinase